MSRARSPLTGARGALGLACLLAPFAAAGAASPLAHARPGPAAPPGAAAPGTAVPYRHVQAHAPLSGHWMCATSPVALRQLPGLPDGTLHQRIAYSADAQGRWSSNASLVFQPHAHTGSYRLRTHASGTHALLQDRMVERLQRFDLLPPFDHSTPLARTLQRNFNAWLLLVQHQLPQRSYRLQMQGPDGYLLEPLLPKHRSTVRVACRRMASPARA